MTLDFDSFTLSMTADDLAIATSSPVIDRRYGVRLLAPDVPDIVVDTLQDLCHAYPHFGEVVGPCLPSFRQS